MGNTPTPHLKTPGSKPPCLGEADNQLLKVVAFGVGLLSLSLSLCLFMVGQDSDAKKCGDLGSHGTPKPEEIPQTDAFRFVDFCC